MIRSMVSASISQERPGDDLFLFYRFYRCAEQVEFRRSDFTLSIPELHWAFLTRDPRLYLCLTFMSWYGMTMIFVGANFAVGGSLSLDFSRSFEKSYG